MKVATLRDGTRDGALVVVDSGLLHYAPVSQVNTLQSALDNWRYYAPLIDAACENLNRHQSKTPSAFHSANCESPLPRAYQWMDEVLAKFRKTDELLMPQ